MTRPILSFAFDFKLLKHFNYVNNKTLAAIKRRIHPKKTKTELRRYAKSCNDRRMDSVYRAFRDLRSPDLSVRVRGGRFVFLYFSIFFFHIWLLLVITR